MDIRDRMIQIEKKADTAAPARDKVIVRTSLVGILANFFLAAFKAGVGLLSHSIAVILDAVNNISDAASSVITIVGTRLARKAPDKKHPFGHGRAEYLSAMLISMLVIYAGVASLVESVKKILDPELPDYSPAALAIITVAVVVKILLGRYVKSVGLRVRSDSLVNSGTDAMLDSVISASTLLAAVIYLLFHISLEAWLGAVISLVIVKSGVEMLRDTLSQILGESIDSETANSIRETVASFPGVTGAYDLILNNYGPDAFNGSVHIEVPDTFSAAELDELIREITVAVYQKHNVLLTAIGVYSVNTKDPEAAAVREAVRAAVLRHEHALQMHGFFLDREKKTIRCDVVISFDAGDREKLYREIVEEIQALYPDYSLQVALDTDFCEE